MVSDTKNGILTLIASLIRMLLLLQDVVKKSRKLVDQSQFVQRGIFTFIACQIALCYNLRFSIVGFFHGFGLH